MSSKIIYSKPPIDIQTQIKLLQQRGLIINDKNKLEHILSTVSYYRLSAYFYYFLEIPKEEHVFKNQTDFDDVFSLYCFDRELRKLISNELEKLEVSFRTQIIYNLSMINGSFWLENSSLFHNDTRRLEIIERIKKDIQKSDENFIKSFINKYSNPLPPSWICLEIVTFGQLSEIYKALKFSKERKKVAEYYGITEVVFISWLHNFVYIRNICAHHSRLWNRTLGVKPLNPEKTKYNWLSTTPRNDKIYMVLSMIIYLLKTIHPKSTFNNKLIQLFNRYQNISLKQMGFPDDWRDEMLWK